MDEPSSKRKYRLSDPWGLSMLTWSAAKSRTMRASGVLGITTYCPASGRVSLMSAMGIPSLGCKKIQHQIIREHHKAMETRLTRKDALVRRNSWEIKKGCPSRIKKNLQRQNISAEVLFIDAAKPEYAWRINQHYCGYSRGQHPPEVCAARFAPHTLLLWQINIASDWGVVSS